MQRSWYAILTLYFQVILGGISGAHKVSLIPPTTFEKLSQAADPLGTTCVFSIKVFTNYKLTKAVISGRVAYGVGLQPLACWDCVFESRRGYVCLSFVIVVCCQVHVSAKGPSLVQRNPTECCVSVISKPQQRGGLDPLWLSSHEKRLKKYYISLR